MTLYRHRARYRVRLAALSVCALSSAAAAEVKTTEVAYKGGGLELKGFVAYDGAAKGKRPGVLVVHEWWGHNNYVRRRARMLAELGYVAFAIDMYGDGRTASHPKDAMRFMTAAMSNMTAAEQRFTAALELLRAHRASVPDKIAAIGYCFGGAIVLHMARIGTDLKGVASFHGNLSAKKPAQPGGVKAEVLVLHGAADPFVPKAQVVAFKKEMRQARTKLRFIAYPGATHAFTNKEADTFGKRFKLPLAYHPQADKKSWGELQRFLARIFKG